MLCLTSAQAMQLAADFALTADYIRAAGAADAQARAKLLETASRAAFLKAQAIARDEELRPVFGQSFRRTAFAVA
jgi:acyl-coenzyme A thioesterase PaaI-like protein